MKHSVEAFGGGIHWMNSAVSMETVCLFENSSESLSLIKAPKSIDIDEWRTKFVERTNIDGKIISLKLSLEMHVYPVDSIRLTLK